MIKSQNPRKWIINELGKDKIETINIKLIMIKKLNDERSMIEMKPILINEGQ